MEDSLAVRFANTRYVDGGQSRDRLADVAGLHTWLERTDLAAQVTEPDLEVFWRLRDSARSVLHAVTTGEALPRDDVAVLNSAAAAAPRWPELVLAAADPTGVRLEERSSATPVVTARARLAAAVIELVGSDQRERVRACGGPGCVLFFEQSRSRRAWCSPGCGNRARVARHYERTRHASPADARVETTL